MDSRFIFLHHAVSELRGHGEEARARDGAGSKRGIRVGGKSPIQGEPVTGSEQRVAKSVEEPSRKAAIVYCMPVP